jgi:hypothetical protein
VHPPFGPAPTHPRTPLPCLPPQLLRLLLVCLCEPLYQKTEAYAAFNSRLTAVATSPDCPYAAPLFFSLLNTVLGFDPVGWGLPYGGWVGRASRSCYPL